MHRFFEDLQSLGLPVLSIRVSSPNLLLLFFGAAPFMCDVVEFIVGMEDCMWDEKKSARDQSWRGGHTKGEEDTGKLIETKIIFIELIDCILKGLAIECVLWVIAFRLPSQ